MAKETPDKYKHFIVIKAKQRVVGEKRAAWKERRKRLRIFEDLITATKETCELASLCLKSVCSVQMEIYCISSDASNTINNEIFYNLLSEGNFIYRASNFSE